jgi:hypothetical protein
MNDEQYAEDGPDLEMIAPVHPLWVLEEDMRGHGWLAVTHPDFGHGRFKGALDI